MASPAGVCDVMSGRAVTAPPTSDVCGVGIGGVRARRESKMGRMQKRRGKKLS
jgi:hypothetical protein